MNIKIHNRKKGSFYRILALNYMIFTVIVLCVFVGIYSACSLLMEKVVPIPDVPGFLKQVEKTAEQELSTLDFQDYLGDGAAVQVVDNSGQVIFQRGENLQENRFQPGEWECISEYISDTQFLSAELEDLSGSGRSLITRLKYRESGEASVSGYLILDQEREVVSGTLFPGKKSFTPQELFWLRGADQQGRKIYRHTYETSEGDTLHLIFRFYEPDYAAYRDLYKSLDYLWLLFIPAYLCIAVCCIYFLNRTTKRLLRPFNQAIVSFSKGQPGGLENYRGPEEFAEIAENFIRMEKRLEKSSEDRRRLLADISHDLKTPITVIGGYAAAVRDKMVPPEEEKIYLDTIVKKTERVGQLLSAFHEYSKLDHPGMKADLKKEDIGSVCREYLAERYQELDLAGVVLEADLPETPLFCLLDRFLFCRALENLIHNSVTYGGSGITISVHLWEKETEIFLSVSDSGPGIPEELAEKIFMPFVTGDECRGNRCGSGLGLAIVQQIIGLHRGAIQLVTPSVDGRGAEFLISLPKC